MAIGMYVVFPLGRWIDHIPINTMLLLGFYYLCFIVNRTATIPLFLKGGRWPLLAVLILTASVLLMAALTYCHEGWPFYRLADPGKVSLGQQLKSLTTMTGLMAQLPANEFVRIHKSYVVALSHIVSFNSRQVSVEGTILPIGRTYTEAIRQQLAQKAGNV